MIKRLLILLLVLLFAGCAAQGGGSGMASSRSGNALTITKPAQASTIRGPVEVCFEVSGYTVEPAKKGVNEGRGHHHILVDADVPADLSQPLPKDANHVHMGDGSTCKTLDLGPGIHSIRGLFARGNHIPYDPPVTDAVVILVR